MSPVESPAAFNQAGSYGAEQTRRAVFFGMRRDTSNDQGSVLGGLRGAGDLLLSAPGSGMSINIAGGECVVPGNGLQGGYYGRVTATTNLPIATSNPSNPRIDGVYATVTDSQYVGATDTFIVQVVTGTPASGATLSNLTGAGAAPNSSLLLGYILVPAGSTSVVSGNIANLANLVVPSFGEISKTVYGTTSGNYGTSNASFAVVDFPTLSVTLPFVAGYPVEIGFDFHFASGNSSTLPAGYVAFLIVGSGSPIDGRSWALPPSTVASTATFQAHTIVTRTSSIPAGLNTIEVVFATANASWSLYIGGAAATYATFWVRQIFEAA